MAVDFKNAKSALAEIETGIANLSTSEGWTSYLEAASRFHKYSLNNLMLIVLQRPDASRVAGYNVWKSLGRQVKKGESGIRILAPMIKKEEDTGDSKIYGFRTVAVFDVSQTEGNEVPGAPVEELRGEAPEGVYEALVAIGSNLGFTTTFADDLNGANGVTDFASRTIQVLESNEPAQRVKTMAHELGHAILHGDKQSLITRDQKEMEAESVAFVVCRALGIESGTYSFGYVLTWAGGNETATAGLKQSASRIIRAADQIIEGLSAETKAVADEMVA